MHQKRAYLHMNALITEPEREEALKGVSRTTALGVAVSRSLSSARKATVFLLIYGEDSDGKLFELAPVSGAAEVLARGLSAESVRSALPDYLHDRLMKAAAEQIGYVSANGFLNLEFDLDEVVDDSSERQAVLFKAA